MVARDQAQGTGGIWQEAATDEKMKFWQAASDWSETRMTNEGNTRGVTLVE